MIIELERFVAEERPFWTELDQVLARLENDAGCQLDLAQVQRLHYLYQRASADLARVATFSAEPETRRYLEALVARAYGEIHETRRRPHRVQPLQWFAGEFPRTFRRHLGAFWLATTVTLVGVVFGSGVVALDPPSKTVIIPFSPLHGSPSERVAEEEQAPAQNDRLHGAKTTFAAYLMANNVKVSIFALALGMTWGIGTVLLLFFNGAMLGAVALDYMLDGQTRFLFGWLLPHGSVEITAILLAGQAGMVLASALIGWGTRASLRTRMRQVSRDLVTLIGGVAVMLVWAGFVEAFFSQYHEPVLPYTLKIVFGLTELVLVVAFLARAGAAWKEPTHADMQ